MYAKTISSNILPNSPFIITLEFEAAISAASLNELILALEFSKPRSCGFNANQD